MCLNCNPSIGHFHKESAPELAAHFSVSLDYGPESPLKTDPISFNSLKEKVELVLGGEGGSAESGSQAERNSSNEVLVFVETEGIARHNPEVSFEEMVGKSSKGVSTDTVTV